MALSENDEEEQNTMVVERQELMAVEGKPQLRHAHFLKPMLNPKSNELYPKHPFHSLSLTHNNCDLTKMVSFRGRPRALEGWKAWVEKMEETHKGIWVKVGIFDAIRASTYKILRDSELLIALAERWCVETNTFVFPWGEATVTLEDVMILGGFSVLGGFVLSCNSWGRDVDEIKTKLYEALRKSRRDKANVPSHPIWMDYFCGKGGELEHVGFLVLWLSRYVLPQSAHHWISPDVFDIAISLAKGIRIALAPVVLASIYRDLSKLKKKIASWTSIGNIDYQPLILWAPFQIVQLWAWERFWMLAPRPMPLLPGEPRLARWHDLSKLYLRMLRREIESCGDCFLWRPYAICVDNGEFPRFYCDDEMSVVLNSDSDDVFLAFARCLRPCELVGMDCIEVYLPHRVGMQFGMDQGIPGLIARSNHDCQVAWSSYDMSLGGLKLYVPHRLSEGDVTVQYSDWWRAAFVGHDRASTCLAACSDGVIGSDVGSSKEIPSEKYLPVEGMICEYRSIVINEASSQRGMNPTLALKQKQDHGMNLVMEKGSEMSDLVAMLEEKENWVNESHSGKDHPQNAFLKAVCEAGNVRETVSGADSEKICSLVAAQVDEMPVHNLVDDLVMLSDNEETVTLVDSYLSQITELEERVTRAESKLSVMKASALRT